MLIPMNYHNEILYMFHTYYCHKSYLNDHHVFQQTLLLIDLKEFYNKRQNMFYFFYEYNLTKFRKPDIYWVDYYTNLLVIDILLELLKTVHSVVVS